MTFDPHDETDLALLRAGFDLGQLPNAVSDLEFWPDRVADAMRVVAGSALGSWTERAVALHARDELANKVFASGSGPWGDHTTGIRAAQEVLLEFDIRYAALLKHFGNTGPGMERWRLAGRVAQIPIGFWETFQHLEGLLPESGDDPYEGGSSIPFAEHLTTLTVAAALTSVDGVVVPALNEVDLAPWGVRLPDQLRVVSGAVNEWLATRATPVGGWAVMVDADVPFNGLKTNGPRLTLTHLLSAPAKVRVAEPFGDPPLIYQLTSVVPAEVALGLRHWRASTAVHVYELPFPPEKLNLDLLRPHPDSRVSDARDPLPGLAGHIHALTDADAATGTPAEVGQCVLDAIATLPQVCNGDELAWLGLTSKAELPVRDRLGWLLQQRVSTHLTVAREWNRADLAILDSDGTPLALVEGKAIYGFDALNTITRTAYVARVQQDLAKSFARAPHACVTATVLMTTPTSPWQQAANAAIAYPAGNRRTAGDSSSLARATEAMAHALQTIGHVHHLRIGRGTAFGSDVTTTLFVVRPVANRNG